MRSVKTIVVVVLPYAIMLALVLTLSGGMALEVLPEAEVEETPEGADWAHTRATHPATLWAACSGKSFDGRAYAAGCQSLSLYCLHVLLI